jgi:alpha,alpha-trehalose phosphorylase
MIRQGVFTVEPWCLRESALDLDLLAQTESVFALANGHLGWRANLDEGEPHGLPGTYLNGVHEKRPLPYAETGYGFPESGQTVINITNGKLIRLFVDDEPFDVRYGELRSHERLLDFRAGTLTRQAEWVSPAGQGVRVSAIRLVSFTQRAIAAVCYDVEPLDRPARIAVQSELLANEQLPPSGGDPRVAAVLENPLASEFHRAEETAVVLVHMTKRSGLRVGAAMDHQIECPPGGAGRVAGIRRRRHCHRDHGPAAGAAVARDQVRRIRLVGSALAAGRPRSGVGGAERGPAHRLGRAAGRAARLSGRLLGPGRRGDRW